MAGEGEPIRSIPVPRGLADDVVRIRTFEQRDAPAVVAACNDPETVRWTRVPQPYTEDTARGWFAMHADERAAGTGASFAGVDPRTDELLASVGFVGTDWDNGIVEIGYWVAPDARGRGVAPCATRMLAVWAFRELDVARAELVIATDNAASLRAAEKAGFTREGVLRAYRADTREDRRLDMVMFSLVPSDL